MSRCPLPGPCTARILCVALLVSMAATVAAAPWRYEGASDGLPARAEASSATGDRLVLWRDGQRVLADFTVATLSALSPDSCPTFQVDTRTPLHYYALADGCTVSGRQAHYVLLEIPARRFVSDVLYGLMNGNAVAFRYQTSDGAYHESHIALTRSKAALLRALGRDLDVQPAGD